MESRDIIFKMAFSFLKKRINFDILRNIIDSGVTPEDFFLLPTKDLISRTGISHNHEFDKVAREEAFSLASKEWDMIRHHNITPLFVLDDDYPSQLAEIDDPPLVLYKLGEASIPDNHLVSVVGTRRPTVYGLEFCNTLIEEMSVYFPYLTVVSGLAYGIDACAHRKALEKGITTVAVVAHGLNMIYPAAHRNLAKEIIRSGGIILSEYPFNTKPFKPNFLARNRIVAGLSQATVVVESAIKGGAMSTANFAFVYNRDVMALPGRTTDELSAGCNLLIRKNKAHLIENAADFIEASGWQPLNLPVNLNQRNLFPELEGDAKLIYEYLKAKRDPVQMDQICQNLKIPASQLLALLSEMEFDGIIMRLPGNRYSLS